MLSAGFRGFRGVFLRKSLRKVKKGSAKVPQGSAKEDFLRVWLHKIPRRFRKVPQYFFLRPNHCSKNPSPATANMGQPRITIKMNTALKAKMGKDKFFTRRCIIPRPIKKKGAVKTSARPKNVGVSGSDLHDMPASHAVPERSCVSLGYTVDTAQMADQG